jgi:anhydro-N-acetylmuramic acid kinase
VSPAANKSMYRAIGVMSGTSMDAIDVAVIETDGKSVVLPDAGGSYPYHPRVQQRLLEVIADPQQAEFAPLADVEAAVTEAHGDAIACFMKDNAIGRPEIDVIGLHGQTVFHRPERRFTRQLGSAAAIAARFGVTTVGRFRHADIAAGGEGAPLVPLYHQALAAKLSPPVMVLNLGGVGNVTYIRSDQVIAFDTGPASALMDDFVRRRCGLPFDAEGRIAASGTSRTSLVEAFARHSYFDRPPPKSLDRNEFRAAAASVEPLSDGDAMATLTEFTVVASVAALRHVPQRPREWLVTGGGRHNRHLMNRLAVELRCPVVPVETVGWDGDMLEAQCFGYLAVRSLLGLPISLPTTTGVPHPLTGGEVSPAI